MVRDGSIYIDMSADGYDNISLGCYRSQTDEMEFIGSEQRSAYGNLQVFNVAGKNRYRLESVPMTFKEYYQIRNHISSTLGRVENVYIDSEGGNILATVRITGQRQMSNDKWVIDLTLNEV